MSIIKNLVEQRILEKTPIWLMRQAGRYMPEYLAVRKNIGSFLDMCYTPEVASEITMQPMKKFNFDAAIIFSDILVIPDSLGINVDFVKDKGPVLSSITSVSELKNKKYKLQKIYEAIKLVSNNLDKHKSFIGFAGAPWTILCYMIDGSSSKNFSKTKSFIKNNKKEYAKIIEILIDSISEHLIAQIDHGVDVVQLFDSWSGLVQPEDYYDVIIHPTKEIISRVKKQHPNIPFICFPRGSSFLYKDYVENVGLDIIGVDEFVPLWWIKENLSKHAIIQGNMDPYILLEDKQKIINTANKIETALGRGKYIFNLGHGVLPTTNVENVDYLRKNFGN